jgi:hypothetical protein
MFFKYAHEENFGPEYWELNRVQRWLERVYAEVNTRLFFRDLKKRFKEELKKP